MSSSPKTPAPPPPPQPDAPAAKAIFGAEDSPVEQAQKRTAQRRNLTASYLTAPTGVGVQL
ncbi:hypothetical protein QTI51_09550 [Variovorax sp. J22G73]|uniref:hypothetical protein n=1 Tax=unclassified Variovorax TaxID=663243 RepID=UPI002578305B|nr:MULTISPECIES: hypothetical protein [unclassified Variovorax]MDM0006456.1 hypothetical protein [Variovorax sp. J22R203]MDM0097521.1 hypothetical protein [Variovorax sp. J22G73]